jgi:hypothetical protein
MMDAEAKTLPKGLVIGMQRPSPSASVALANAHLSAAAKKNIKRKEKRKTGTDTTEAVVEPPDDWDAEEPVEEPAVKEAEESTTQDPEKRARALQKKIKQVGPSRSSFELGLMDGNRRNS